MVSGRKTTIKKTRLTGKRAVKLHGKGCIGFTTLTETLHKPINEVLEVLEHSSIGKYAFDTFLYLVSVVNIKIFGERPFFIVTSLLQLVQYIL
jgi:hypothetical protein